MADGTWQPQSWRRQIRLGPLSWPALPRAVEHTAVLLLVLLVVATAAETGSGLTTAFVQPPAAAMRAFFAAWQRGDADTVWKAISIPAPHADTAHLARADLVRTLASSQQIFAGARLAAPQVTGSSAAEIPVTWSAGGTTARGNWQLKRSGLGWKVLLPAALASVAVPTAGQVKVDDQPLAGSAAASTTVALFPGGHTFALAATRWLGADQKALDLQPFAQPAAIAFAPQPTANAETAALTALKDGFKACAASTSASQSGCPQFASVSSTSFQWTLIGDPTAGVSWGYDAGRLSGAGHFQMLLGYLDSTLHGTQHVVVGGGYRAGFEFQTDTLKPVGISPASDVPGVSRPAAATDDAIRNAVRPAFATCAQATALSAVDCPMRGDTTDPSIQNVSWTLDSDPLAQASVTFDPVMGAFNVAGSFAMHDHYRAVGLITFTHDEPVVGQYATTVLWSDGKPIVAGITRTA